jgi:hypothetical protein
MPEPLEQFLRLSPAAMMRPPVISRRDYFPDPWRRLTAAAGVAVVLALTVLAVSPTLHAWLHGEKQLDANDDCAVVLFAHGLTPALAALVLLGLFLRRRPEILPLPAVLFLVEPSFDLPPGCGPPLS